MRQRLDFAQDNIGELLKERKSGEHVWGDLTRAMRRDFPLENQQ